VPWRASLLRSHKAPSTTLTICRTMVWASSLDIVGGPQQSSAASALSLYTNREALSLKGTPAQVQAVQSCYISECGQDCDATYTPVLVPVKKKHVDQAANITHGCPDDQVRNYFCPKNNVPECRWVGSAPACGSSKCNSNESSVTYATGKCSSGHKTLCCTNTDSDKALSQCGESCNFQTLPRTSS